MATKNIYTKNAESSIDRLGKLVNDTETRAWVIATLNAIPMPTTTTEAASVIDEIEAIAQIYRQLGKEMVAEEMATFEPAKKG